jgi:hypothetical protein
MTETSRRGFEQPTPAEQAGGVQKESLCKWCVCCVDHLESHVKACLCRTFPAKSDWLREAASIPGIGQVVHAGCRAYRAAQGEARRSCAERPIDGARSSLPRRVPGVAHARGAPSDDLELLQMVRNRSLATFLC